MEHHGALDESDLVLVRDPSYDVTRGIPPAHHSHESVRRLTHEGHDIEVHTSYKIVIDGREFPDTIAVMDDGSVRYHGLPQYATNSALELAVRIVDELLEEEPPPIDGCDETPAEHHGAP